MIYVFVDTCIYNRIVTQGQPGSTMECFGELKRLATEGKIQVVVPEVVVLEFERFRRGLDNQYSASIENLKKDVANACAKKPWSEIDDVRQSLASHIDAEAAKKRAAFPDRIEAVREWLMSDAAVRVPFDSDIWLLGKRRLMSGRMPPTEKKSDQDACLIESLVKSVPRDQELYFCSGNTNDFALQIPNKGFAFHPLLAEDLPKTRFFKDLSTLVEAIKSGEAPSEPTPEEVKEAARKEAALASSAGQLPPFLLPAVGDLGNLLSYVSNSTNLIKIGAGSPSWAFHPRCAKRYAPICRKRI